MATKLSTSVRTNKVLAAHPDPSGSLVATRLQSIDETGQLLVELPGLGVAPVAWLESSDAIGVALNPGDLLLVLVGGGTTPSVALGRIGAYQRIVQPQHVQLRAAESLSLQCGKSSIDMRADGKVLIRGEDVLVRAKGTKRIRAGTVSIN
jgi:hypothetical protein